MKNETNETKYANALLNAFPNKLHTSEFTDLSDCPKDKRPMISAETMMSARNRHLIAQ